MIMKTSPDDELNQLLKSARMPAQPEGYEEDFSRMVLTGLRAGRYQAQERGRRRLGWLAWGWAAATCLLLGLAAGFWAGRSTQARSNNILANAKMIHETLAEFPHQVQAIVQVGQEVKLVLADQPDVPDSQPLYIHYCDGKKCMSVVTFSGQEVELGGEKVTALADAQGGVILEGEKFIWTSGGGNAGQSGVKIEARML